jgi:hypothetical protein
MCYDMLCLDNNKNKSKQMLDFLMNLFNKSGPSRAWWRTPLIPALGRQFKASLVCKVSSRTTRATQRNPVSKTKTKRNKKKTNK